MAVTRYDMPALFGPSHVPDRTVVPFAQVASISFETSWDAAELLVPRFFRPADPPVIAVSRIEYHDVDYLGGGGCREIVVMGFATLPAEMEAMPCTSDTRSFAAAECGTPLVEGLTTGLRQLSVESLATVNRSAAEVRTFGWQLNPGDGAEPDADHPMVTVMQWNYTRAWTGEGAVQS